MAMPVKAFSEIGVSITRFVPKRSTRPVVVPKMPFGSVTPSPITKASGTSSSARSRPSRRASATLSTRLVRSASGIDAVGIDAVGIDAVGIDVFGGPSRRRLRRGECGSDRSVDLRPHFL